jgi:creatinine amidohydrolase
MQDPEVRLERLRPAQIRARMAAAPVCWLPLGAIEYHADHLPVGTDGFTAQSVVEIAARRVGGVVFPWSAMTLGTLYLPWSFRYDRALVADALRHTLTQLVTHGARVVVVHTGHAPIDLIHLVKRVCAEAESQGLGGPEFRAYGVCYLELNAANGAQLGTEWPVAIDHASIVETSWMLALEPDLVDLAALPEDAAAASSGVYGPNPRTRASAAVGRLQIEACSTLLAGRVTRLLAGERLDPLADLRSFVDRYCPESPGLAGRAGPRGVAALLVTNSGPVSRYLTSLELRIDGVPLPSAGLRLANPTAGEPGVPVIVDTLGPESGFYIRRGQVAELRLPGAMEAGRHTVELTLGLAGVMTRNSADEVDFR